MPANDAVYGLGEGGAELYEALKSDDRVRNALALEAARTKDRLDELDNIIQGKGVLHLMQFRLHLDEIDEGGDRNLNVEVKFAAPLAEARGQQTSLANLLSKLAAGDSAGSAKPVPKLEVLTPLDKLKAQGLKKA